MTFIII